MPKTDQPQQPITLSVTEIAAMTGRTVRWVQNLAKDQAIEKDGRGKYRLASVLAGLVSHYEAIIEKGSKSAAASRVTDARAEEIELRLAERRRDLIPQEDALAVVDLVAGEVNKQFTGLPARITRDVRLRRDIEAKLNEAKQKIADAVRDARILAATGRDPTDPDAAD
ncbi:hypothetical protein [Paracoccus sp. KR1-242]|uniref:hypothetical protein n=1 Tax=Paracoccus sp. KR1-242 TaxID=3410028 RepID=UPI003C05D256